MEQFSPYIKYNNFLGSDMSDAIIEDVESYHRCYMDDISAYADENLSFGEMLIEAGYDDRITFVYTLWDRRS